MINFNLKGSLGIKIIFTGFLALVLLIPLGMVESLVRERENRRDEAVREVSSKWGFQQTITGPVLVVPYRQYSTWEQNGKTVSSMAVRNAYFLPETLKFKGGIIPERRSRGLYEVILYSLRDLSVTGAFTRPDFRRLNIPPENALWEQAYIAMGIPDTRGIQKDLSMRWGAKELPFSPGVNNAGIFTTGIHAPVAGLRGAPGRIDYSFSLSLRGSSALSFTPLGKDTVAELDSPWPHPSFFGSYLPSRHRIGGDGFTAGWSVSYFGRNLPQEFIQGQADAASLVGSAFGVRLFVPVDFYQKCNRAVKYGFLFITLTFLAFFLFELFNRLSIHPLQYVMVGAAMCVFYLLFLSLSEQIGFLLSYVTASLAVMALITGYCVKVLKTRGRAGMMLGLLFGLYSVLYVLLENEDYALLLGSLALFVILAAVMYLTRNVDWYRIRLGSPDTEASAPDGA